MALPSIGDILMLSQTAWKVGRAFTAGRKNAPAEFHEVEAEINGLAKVLKLLAEAMFAESDDSLLKQADQEIQEGLTTILASCQQTIQDLDSLMDQYQVVKKTRTQGGFAIERSWSELVINQYQTMMWTTEGGNIQHLRYLLKMHSSSISLTKQALQSKSISRLESVVIPMADKVDSLQQKTSTLSQQLNEANRIVKEIADQNFLPSPEQPPKSPTIGISPPVDAAPEKFSVKDFFPPRDSSMVPRPLMPSAQRSVGSPSSPASPDMSTTIAASSSPRSAVPSPTPSERKRISEFSFGTPSRYSVSSTSSDEESTTSTHRYAYLTRQYSQHSNKASLLSRTTDGRQSQSRPDSSVLSHMLPPPAMELPPLDQDGIEQNMSNLSLHAPAQSGIGTLHRSSTTSSQKERFENAAFRNAAILCDVRGIAVEYAQKVSPDKDCYELKMVEACTNCRIAVVRKREAAADAKNDIRVMTSIWVFSDDNTVRMELKMADGEMYVPYSSYFNPEKVSVTVPCELKFHDVDFGKRVQSTAKTTWINYVFETPLAAALFQNELMGRTLLATFRTSQTLRIHEGLSSAFSYAEQMCGMENLRIWEDNDTLAVIALIHFSPQFRQGYLAFYLNSSTAPIRVKDEGGREVKVRGLRVAVGEKGRKDSAVVEGEIAGGGLGAEEFGGGKSSAKGGRRGSKKGDAAERRKVVTGAKIEFASEVEKREFLALVKEVQKANFELPDLAGVN
ncbi:hypothetical protein K458DRAFT_434198 [Lentithecium fluviatile CBS 122367]|uniref:Fungal N-terminal domain-containing protein n=1 Tax=Lentithecium fluviatile CBS 122367 TaxID=1168545 RepID=A0A6G1IQR2_9PLEO|nr:hypothetical protein K458DRAFT_434198 [Lentithecium fluviatile CBS 122367]